MIKPIAILFGCSLCFNTGIALAQAQPAAERERLKKSPDCLGRLSYIIHEFIYPTNKGYISFSRRERDQGHFSKVARANEQGVIIRPVFLFSVSAS